MSGDEAMNGDDISGDRSKDSPYEPKNKPKIIRVLTVFAYILSVSMVAILLSVYYVFVWDGHPHLGSRIQDQPQQYVSYEKINRTSTPPLNISDSSIAERLESSINFTTTSPIATAETDSLLNEDMPERFVKRSLFVKKLLHMQHVNVLQDAN